jgi:hypothetical protein
MGNCVKSKKKSKKIPTIVRLENAPLPRPFENLPEEPIENEIIIEEDKFSGLPEFYTTSSTSGVWIYSSEINEIQFPEALQQIIETDFLLGKGFSEFQMEANSCRLSFKESIMTYGESVFPVCRSKLRQENYGWRADDGTVRPLLKEVEEILAETSGKLSCKIDGAAFTIDLPKRVIVDITHKTKRSIELL